MFELHVSDQGAQQAPTALAVGGEPVGHAHGRTIDHNPVDQTVLRALPQLVGKRAAGDTDQQVAQLVEAAVTGDVERRENLDRPATREDLKRIHSGLNLPSHVVLATVVLTENLADSGAHSLGRDNARFDLLQAVCIDAHRRVDHGTHRRCRGRQSVCGMHFDLTFATPWLI